MGEATIMHDDGILVPEIDGGKVAGENLLGFNVVRATASGSRRVQAVRRGRAAYA